MRTYTLGLHAATSYFDALAHACVCVCQQRALYNMLG